MPADPASSGGQADVPWPAAEPGELSEEQLAPCRGAGVIAARGGRGMSEFYEATGAVDRFIGEGIDPKLPLMQLAVAGERDAEGDCDCQGHAHARALRAHVADDLPGRMAIVVVHYREPGCVRHPVDMDR